MFCIVFLYVLRYVVYGNDNESFDIVSFFNSKRIKSVQVYNIIFQWHTEHVLVYAWLFYSFLQYNVQVYAKNELGIRVLLPLDSWYFRRIVNKIRSGGVIPPTTWFTI